MTENDNEYLPIINSDEDDSNLIKNIPSFFQPSSLNNRPNLIYTSLFPSTDKLISCLKSDKLKGITTSSSTYQWRINTFGKNTSNQVSQL